MNEKLATRTVETGQDRLAVKKDSRSKSKKENSRNYNA